MQATPKFSIGDTAVYPSHGVADVVNVETKSIGGQELQLYHLAVRSSGLKIIVPIDKAEGNGMRHLANDKDIEQVFDLLRDQDIPTDKQTWNRRHRGFMDKIRTGSIFEVAEVYRDLCVLRKEKQLSDGERNMLYNARDLLVRELAVARDKNEEAVAEELDSMFKH